MSEPFSISLSGLDQERNYGALWIACAIACLFFGPPPLLLTGLAVLFGIALASTRIVLFGKGMLKSGAYAGLVFYVVFASLYLWGPFRDARLGLVQIFGLACLIAGPGYLITWLFRKRIEAMLSKKHATFLELLQPKKKSPPTSAEIESAWKEIESLTPDPVWKRLRGGIIPALKATADKSFHGRSRFGGGFDAPPEFEWPAHKASNLELLAQIDLAEAAEAWPECPLPMTGLLCFFYNTQEQPWGGEDEDLESGRVVYFPPDTTRASEHDDISSVPIRFHRTDSLPPYDDAAKKRVLSMYWNLSEEKKQRHSYLEEMLLEQQESSQLLGFPIPIQGDMDSDLLVACQAYGLPIETSWRLLMQVDSEAALNWCWGDSGMLYFWIPEEDLAAHRFDRVWVVLQCC